MINANRATQTNFWSVETSQSQRMSSPICLEVFVKHTCAILEMLLFFNAPGDQSAMFAIHKVSKTIFLKS